MANSSLDDLKTIEETYKLFQNKIEEVKDNDQALPDCLFLAEKFENQIEFWKEIHQDKEELSVEWKKIKDLEAKARTEYQQLYPVYDRLSTKETVQLIRDRVQKFVKTYQEKIELIQDSKGTELVELLELRDRIKILSDEMEIWLNRFEEKDREEFEKRDALLLSIKQADNKLRDELVLKADEHHDIRDEARQRLIKKPDGSHRFDFWWWHAGE